MSVARCSKLPSRSAPSLRWWAYRERFVDTLKTFARPGKGTTISAQSDGRVCAGCRARAVVQQGDQGRAVQCLWRSGGVDHRALVILFVERDHARVTREANARVRDVDAMTWLDALKLGLAQCFGLFPGMSRPGSTLIGGMLFGLSRQAATEFSRFSGCLRWPQRVCIRCTRNGRCFRRGRAGRRGWHRRVVRGGADRYPLADPLCGQPLAGYCFRLVSHRVRRADPRRRRVWLAAGRPRRQARRRPTTGGGRGGGGGRAQRDRLHRAAL